MQKSCRLSKSIATGLMLSAITAGSASGRGFEFGGSLFRQLDGSVLRSDHVLDLTAVRGNSSAGLGLSAFTGGIDGVRSLLEESGLHPMIHMKVARKLNQASGYGLAGSGSSGTATDYQFNIGAYPVCGVTLRAVEQPNGDTVVVGSVPLVDQVTAFADGDWPDANESARKSVEEIASHQGLSTAGARVTSLSRCLLNEQGSLEPVWNMILYVDGFQFGVLATPWRVASANQRYFDATATVRAYDPNAVSGTLKDFSITVGGDGTMTNDYVTTADYTGAARANSASNNFVYSSTDSHFAEASVFAYVNQQYDFASGKGYVWQGPKPLTVVVHAVIKGTVNNALYTPFDGSSGPYIRVGDGDGATLQNLPYDADVVSHEFGHHVVYQSVTQIDGESLVLHEGLADFLAFSRTGDSCLGESICPASSTLCQVKSKCLRSADNTISYNDDTYKSFSGRAHLQGQLVSGFLWDLRKNNDIPADTLSTYLMEAIKYLPSNAGIKSLVTAMYYVDQLHGGTYKAVIDQYGGARGLSAANLGIDLTSLKSSLSSSGTTESSEESDSKKGGFFGCGTIGNNETSQNSSAWMIVLLAVIPLVFVQTTKRIPVPVRSKRRDDHLS